MPDVDAPPFCDISWRRAGAAAFTAERTPLYDAAVSCAGNSMEAAGFDVRAPDVFLDLAGCTDLPAFAKRLSIWTGAARKRLAFDERRDAALRPPPREAIEALQDGLVRMLAETSWALGARADLADRFAEAATLTKRQYDWAKDILGDAQATVRAVDERLATEAGAEALERAYDEAIRGDLLLACRQLTALDEDRCREANGQGWSATTSGPGHRLAGMTTLTVLQAAHALALVHPHRRQLTPALRERLFGPAPVAAPAP